MASTLVENEDRKHHDIPEEQVAVAAYFIWREGGCRHGYDVDDWYAAIEKLKCESPRIHHYRLPEDMGERTILSITKKTPTPDIYPRRNGMPSKRPL